MSQEQSKINIVGQFASMGSRVIDTEVQVLRVGWQESTWVELTEHTWIPFLISLGFVIPKNYGDKLQGKNYSLVDEDVE